MSNVRAVSSIVMALAFAACATRGIVRMPVDEPADPPDELSFIWENDSPRVGQGAEISRCTLFRDGDVVWEYEMPLTSHALSCLTARGVAVLAVDAFPFLHFVVLDRSGKAAQESRVPVRSLGVHFGRAPWLVGTFGFGPNDRWVAVRLGDFEGLNFEWWTVFDTEDPRASPRKVRSPCLRRSPQMDEIKLVEQLWPFEALAVVGLAEETSSSGPDRHVSVFVCDFDGAEMASSIDSTVLQRGTGLRPLEIQRDVWRSEEVEIDVAGNVVTLRYPKLGVTKQWVVSRSADGAYSISTREPAR